MANCPLYSFCFSISIRLGLSIGYVFQKHTVASLFFTTDYHFNECIEPQERIIMHGETLTKIVHVKVLM